MRLRNKNDIIRIRICIIQCMEERVNRRPFFKLV